MGAQSATVCYASQETTVGSQSCTILLTEVRSLDWSRWWAGYDGILVEHDRQNRSIIHDYINHWVNSDSKPPLAVFGKYFQSLELPSDIMAGIPQVRRWSDAYIWIQSSIEGLRTRGEREEPRKHQNMFVRALRASKSWWKLDERRNTDPTCHHINVTSDNPLQHSPPHSSGTVHPSSVTTCHVDDGSLPPARSAVPPTGMTSSRPQQNPSPKIDNSHPKDVGSLRAGCPATGVSLSEFPLHYPLPPPPRRPVPNVPT